MNISQTTMIAICVGLLIYIAFSVTSINTVGNVRTEFDNSVQSNSDLYNHIATGTDYVYKADTSKSMHTVLLNGITFNSSQYMLLYDSTPYASKGHIAMTLPCNEANPEKAKFQILVGQAPNVVGIPLGFIKNMSSLQTGCLFHGQFGFGDPITDLALKYNGEESIELNGPYSVVISTHESYIPKADSFKEIQHLHGGS